MVNEPKKNFDTSVTLSGLRLDNPVVPASGTFGYGRIFTTSTSLGRFPSRELRARHASATPRPASPSVRRG